MHLSLPETVSTDVTYEAIDGVSKLKECYLLQPDIFFIM
jgi:hypothetical protein